MYKSLTKTKKPLTKIFVKGFFTFMSELLNQLDYKIRYNLWVLSNFALK